MKTALLFLALTCSLDAEDDSATWNALAQSIRERALGGRYPWHHQIGTTIFWVGEIPNRGDPGNLRSAWDPHWIANAPNQNAFYVALPYNDVLDSAHTKPEAATLVPWFRRDFVRPGQSVLRGRWIEIRHGGRVAYAQWLDVGPYHTDDAAYVFGSARPREHPNNDAGLDLSPAVRTYLGLNGTDCCDWRFIEAGSVPPGPWRALPRLF